ncbi:hypothetical protein AK812_SmicGene45767 [Symbiodinium microadriaticum]|uniref:Uncharacterized protein n=1 Tax=Symbiodinium microadriaticum TaxID=2951 RepID=A0A1Q9BVD5_SYMMI|nr:hypothetical protein AK812_SmicGene45767 [Symbiodinium microadriaticum]
MGTCPFSENSARLGMDECAGVLSITSELFYPQPSIMFERMFGRYTVSQATLEQIFNSITEGVDSSSAQAA